MLQQPDIQEAFVEQFKTTMARASMARNIDEELLDINSSIRQAAQATLPTKPATQHKPWISKLTLQMIGERNFYRAIGERSKEKLDGKQIKRQVQIELECCEMFQKAIQETSNAGHTERCKWYRGPSS